jgi:hypothetical protein
MDLKACKHKTKTDQKFKVYRLVTQIQRLTHLLNPVKMITKVNSMKAKITLRPNPQL